MDVIDYSRVEQILTLKMRLEFGDTRDGMPRNDACRCQGKRRVLDGQVSSKHRRLGRKNRVLEVEEIWGRQRAMYSTKPRRQENGRQWGECLEDWAWAWEGDKWR